MLKSLKLGELGIDRDPLLLPSVGRSELLVLRSKVRNILDIHRASKVGGKVLSENRFLLQPELVQPKLAALDNGKAIPSCHHTVNPSCNGLTRIALHMGGTRHMCRFILSF